MISLADEYPTKTQTLFAMIMGFRWENSRLNFPFLKGLLSIETKKSLLFLKKKLMFDGQ